MTERVQHDPLKFPDNVYQIVSEDCVQVLSGVRESLY